MRRVRRITRSCSTLLCFRLCSRANGITFRARDIYTAVPGTRTGGDFSSEEIIASSELPCSCIRRSRRKRSLFQVVITVNITRPRDNGSQPPETILSRFAENSGTSMHRKATSISPTNSLFQCQFLRATVAERMEVSTMVPVTAIPYAAARLEECSKLTMTITTETYSSQLINGI